MNLDELYSCFINAIESKSLRTTLCEIDDKRGTLSFDAQVELDQAIAAIETIDRDLDQEMSRVGDILNAAGIAVDSIDVAYPKNILHCVEVLIKENQLCSATEALEQNGYQTDDQASGIDLPTYAKFYGGLAFWSSEGLQFRVQLRWRPKYSESRIGMALRPSLTDLQLEVPSFAWPLYCAFALFRKLLRRSKSVGVQTLGPFLGTPSEMVSPLLLFSGLQSHHQLVDIGCGDGRILLTAAKNFGCQATGYETNEPLVEIARRKAHESGLKAFVTIKPTDANEADVSSADVVFIFLPANQISKLVSDLLPKMKPQAVLIAHEQDKIEVAQAPDQKQALILECGVSVACKWIAQVQ